MNYKIDYKPCFNSKIYPSSLQQGEFADLTNEATKICHSFIGQIEQGHWPAFGAAEQYDDIAQITEVADYLKDFENIVIFGTGGSSLCAEALVKFKHSKLFRHQTNIIFVSNVDPQTILEFYRILELPKTVCLVVSKSGGTIETISQMGVAIEQFSKQGLDISKHFVAISEDTDNPLRQIAAKYNIKTYEHNPNIGGRFSILSNVGLVPALVAGVDISAVRRGAASILQNPNEAIKGAAMHVGFMRRGIKINVLMPYMDSLEYFTSWHKQVWAESLGKNGTGSIPIRSIGTTDQHSQLQLYLDGPKDKLFTIIALDRAGQGNDISTEAVADTKLDYLAGRKIGDIITAEQDAIIEAIKQRNLPLREIRLDKLDDTVLGQLVMHFMLETVITAGLLGIDPFDQPAVELGKDLTRQILGV